MLQLWQSVVLYLHASLMFGWPRVYKICSIKWIGRDSTMYSDGITIYALTIFRTFAMFLRL